MCVVRKSCYPVYSILREAWASPYNLVDITSQDMRSASNPHARAYRKLVYDYNSLNKALICAFTEFVTQLKDLYLFYSSFFLLFKSLRDSPKKVKWH